MRVLSVAKRYSDQPENTVITVSRIKDASCPFRYFKEYVERPKHEKAFVSIEAGMGEFFHSYVENRFRSIIARQGGVSAGDALDVDDVIRNFRLSFIWEGNLRAPYRIVRRQYGIADFVQRLQSTAENFNGFLTSRLVGHTVLATEGALQVRTDSFYIRGKHDLITRDPSGALALWDWKTGKPPNPAYYEDFINQKTQLGIYAIWMRHQFETGNVRGTAVFLRDGCGELSELFTEAVEQDVLNHLHSWRVRLNNLSSYNAIPNNLCDWCGWNPVCPAFGAIKATACPGTDSAPGTTVEPAPSKAQPCFVATCVFPSKDAPALGLLRRYRDSVLARSALGNVAIRGYGRVGPIAARLLRRTTLGRALVRILLERLALPIVRRQLKRVGHEDESNTSDSIGPSGSR